MAMCRVVGRDGAVRLSLKAPRIDQYALVQPDGTAPTLVAGNQDVVCLGSGGYGVVVRARDKTGLSRAIKLIKDERVVTPQFSSSLEKEIALTNRRPFKNIVTIIEYGKDFVASPDAIPIDFAVSPYVPGSTLFAFFERLLMSDSRRTLILQRPEYRARVRDLLFQIVRDIVDGLVELSDAEILHCDVKPDNIIVSHDEDIVLDSDTIAPHTLLRRRYRAFVVDLGVAKSMRDRAAGDLDLTGTSWFMHGSYAATKGKHDKHNFLTVDLADFSKVWRQHDLHCLGRSLATILMDCQRVLGQASCYYSHPTATSQPLVTETQREGFWAEVLGQDFDVMEELVRRLALPGHEPIHTAEELQGWLGVFPPRASGDIFDSDLLLDRNPRVSIRVGSTSVKLSAPVDAIVDHPSFQRLRGINQLAYVSLVFPDATHSRFSHSLRTYHLAKKFVRALARKPEFRATFDRAHADTLLAAALLHDVGQYPFAHSIEDLRKMSDDSPDCAAWRSAIPHDQERIVGLLEENDSRGRKIADILGEYDIVPKTIKYIASKTPMDLTESHWVNISRTLISGVIDIDRVSYLTYDAERTGVSFGGAIDIDALVEGLTIRVDNQVGLGLERGAVSAAEAVLVATHWMYRNVYWRHTNRAFMACVKYAMERMLLRNPAAMETYLAECRTDESALSWIHARAEELVASGKDERLMFNPVGSIRNGMRIGYKRAMALKYGPEGERGANRGFDNPLYNRVVKFICPTVEDAILVKLEGVLSGLGAGTVHPGEVLLDVPLKKRLFGGGTAAQERATSVEAGRSMPVWVRRRDLVTKRHLEWQDLTEFSLIGAGLSRAEDHSGRKIRVFVSAAAMERLPRSSRQSLDEHLRAALASGLEEGIQKLAKDFPAPKSAQESTGAP